MKIASIILSILALGLIAFNATRLNFNAPFQGESINAVSMILASLCVIILLQILRTSKRIEEVSKTK